MNTFIYPENPDDKTITSVKGDDGHLYWLTGLNQHLANGRKPNMRFYGNEFITFCKDCFIVTGKHRIDKTVLQEYGDRDICQKCEGVDLKTEEVPEDKWHRINIGESPIPSCLDCKINKVTSDVEQLHVGEEEKSLQH